MRLRLAMIALAALLPAPGFADPRDEMLKSLAQCSELPDTAARTGCYDRLAPNLRALVGAEPSTSAVSSPNPPPPEVAPPPPEKEQSVFGSLFSNDTPPPSAAQMTYQPIGQEILPVTIGVADYDITPAGFTVTLDNGQVWQERGRSDVPPFKGGQKNVVTLEHGLIGGVDLYLQGFGHLYKVRRIK